MRPAQTLPDHRASLAALGVLGYLLVMAAGLLVGAVAGFVAALWLGLVPLC